MGRDSIGLLMSPHVRRLGVDIQFGKPVVENEGRQRAEVVTDQGERREADVVIAADGVGTKATRSSVPT